MKLSRQARHGPARSASRSRSLLGGAVAYGAAKLIGFVVQAGRRRGFAEWHAIVAARWNARMHDHRMAMVGAGIVTLAAQHRAVRNAVDVLLPAAERRLFARQHHPAAGQHAQADRGGGRPRRGDRRQGSQRRARVRAGQCRQRPREHRAQEEPRGHQHRVRAQPVADARRDPRRARQLPEPERRRARTRIRATSCSISAATIRCS